MCGKRRIPTEEQAQRDLADAAFKRALGNPRRAECRYYFCDTCTAYHLTSLPEWPPPEEASASLDGRELRE